MVSDFKNVQILQAFWKSLRWKFKSCVVFQRYFFIISLERSKFYWYLLNIKRCMTSQ